MNRGRRWDRFRALGLWLEGVSFDAIDDDLILDQAGAGRRLVRAAIAVLRREFAGDRAPP